MSDRCHRGQSADSFGFSASASFDFDLSVSLGADAYDCHPKPPCHRPAAPRPHCERPVVPPAPACERPVMQPVCQPVAYSYNGYSTPDGRAGYTYSTTRPGCFGTTFGDGFSTSYGPGTMATAWNSNYYQRSAANSWSTSPDGRQAATAWGGTTPDGRSTAGSQAAGDQTGTNSWNYFGTQNTGSWSRANDGRQGAAAWGSSDTSGTRVGSIGWGTDCNGVTQGTGSMGWRSADGSVGTATIRSANNGYGEIDWTTSTGTGRYQWGPGFASTYTVPANPYSTYRPLG